MSVLLNILETKTNRINNKLLDMAINLNQGAKQ